jgi:CBS domain-containing protein
MRIQHLYTPNARTAYKDDPLAEAARAMCNAHIGALVVVDRADPQRRPIGILTDRDIVRGELGRSADLFCLTVGEVMTPDPLLLPAALESAEAIDALNRRAVRRAPVIDASGSLVGMVTLDDLLPALAEELAELAKLMGTQAQREGRARP